MKRIINLLFISAFLIISCNTEDETLTTNDVNAENEYFVTLDSALQIANDFFYKLHNEDSSDTRLSIKRIVSNVTLLDVLGTKTRSSLSNIGGQVYLINYSNNNGFAIISADKRLRPIYAISDEGQLNLSDTIRNIPIKMFFDKLSIDVANSLIESRNVPYVIHYDSCSYNVVASQAEPVLSRKVREWHQEYPYNNYCPVLSDGSHADVGCGAIACGMVCSHFQWPPKIVNRRLLWSGIRRGASIDDVAFFLRQLGIPENLDMEYTDVGSGSDFPNIIRTFQNLGYERPNNPQNFNESKVRSILDNAQDRTKGEGIVIVYGENTNNPTAHIWVIDGYARNVYKYKQEELYSPKNTTLFHCVWGWNCNNGYFYWGNSKTLGGTTEVFDIDDNHSVLGDTDTHWYGNLKYISKFVAIRNY